MLDVLSGLIDRSLELDVLIPVPLLGVKLKVNLIFRSISHHIQMHFIASLRNSFSGKSILPINRLSFWLKLLSFFQRKIISERSSSFMERFNLAITKNYFIFHFLQGNIVKLASKIMHDWTSEKYYLHTCHLSTFD